MVAGIPSISFIYHIRAFKKLTFVTTVTLPTSFSFFPGDIEHFTRQMPSTTPAINRYEEVTVYVVFSLTSSSAYSHLFSQNDDTNGGGFFRVYADFPSTQNMVWQIDSGINMLSIKSANAKRLVQSSFCASLIGSLASPSIADTVLHSAEIKQMQKCSLESGCCLVVDSSRDL
jgi:hypothetical protein